MEVGKIELISKIGDHVRLYIKGDTFLNDTKTNIGYQIWVVFTLKKGLVKTPAKMPFMILSQTICSVIKDFYTLSLILLFLLGTWCGVLYHIPHLNYCDEKN